MNHYQSPLLSARRWLRDFQFALCALAIAIAVTSCGRSGEASDSVASSTSVPSSLTTSASRPSTTTSTILRSTTTSTAPFPPTSSIPSVWRPEDGVFAIEAALPPNSVLARQFQQSRNGRPEKTRVYWTPNTTLVDLYYWFAQSPIFRSRVGRYEWCSSTPDVGGSPIVPEALRIIGDKGFNWSWRLPWDSSGGLFLQIPSDYLNDQKGYRGDTSGILYYISALNGGLADGSGCA